ncbi:hypothetical protein TMatcc_000621 [Talaromyces marneffei ATCC 18224]
MLSLSFFNFIQLKDLSVVVVICATFRANQKKLLETHFTVSGGRDSIDIVSTTQIPRLLFETFSKGDSFASTRKRITERKISGLPKFLLPNADATRVLVLSSDTVRYLDQLSVEQSIARIFSRRSHIFVEPIPVASTKAIDKGSYKIPTRRGVQFRPTLGAAGSLVGSLGP